MLEIPDYVKNMRSKMLAWSAACLFIAKTKAFPNKLILLGINLQDQESTVSLFIIGFTTYYFLQFFLPTALELTKHFIPMFYNKIARKLTSDFYGLTFNDIENDEATKRYQSEHPQTEHTLQDEANNIYKKYNENIKILENKLTNITTWLTIFIGVFIPTVFCIISIFSLARLI